MNTLRAALGAVLVTGFASTVFAQTTSVGGTVTNAQGGVIANADVTMRVLPAPGAPAMPRMPNMPGMGERTAQTGADGGFSFEQVAPGQYVLQVDFSGFERSSQEITVANQPQTVSVTLLPLEIVGAEAAAAPAGAGAAAVDTQALLTRIRTLEQRISELESNTVF